VASVADAARSFQFIKQINKPPHLHASPIAMAFYGRRNTHILCRPDFTNCGGGVGAQRQLMTDNLMVDNLGLFSAACGISVRRLMRKRIECFVRKQTLSADGSGSFCECPEPED
jgi:hypothetical protein